MQTLQTFYNTPIGMAIIVFDWLNLENDHTLVRQSKQRRTNKESENGTMDINSPEHCSWHLDMVAVELGKVVDLNALAHAVELPYLVAFA